MLNMPNNSDVNPCAGAKNVCLVIEDNQPFREILTIYLQRHGIGAEQAGDGETGLLLYLANPDKYCAVLLDMQLPGMNGFEVLAHIRQSSKAGAKTIPIIAMTGSLLSDEKNEFAFSALLRKPFDLQELITAIEKLVTCHGG